MALQLAGDQAQSPLFDFLRESGQAGAGKIELHAVQATSRHGGQSGSQVRPLEGLGKYSHAHPAISLIVSRAFRQSDFRRVARAGMIKSE